MTQAALPRPTDLPRLTAGLPKSAIEFFVVFARCEYALKRGGFARAGNGQNAEADWNALAHKLGSRFFDSIRSKIPTIVSSPPQRQILEDGALAWRPQPSPQNAEELLLAIRRLRNNLFHGGKFSFAQIDEPARNDTLLREALTVLDELLDATPHLRNLVANP
jgi:hypothetical protein